MTKIEYGLDAANKPGKIRPEYFSQLRAHSSLVFVCRLFFEERGKEVKYDR
jgi:hypothetical protein